MRFAISFMFASCATPIFAAPNVVVDIAPLHGLVSEVMAGVGTPALLLPPNSDAHSYAMRPSDAQMLTDAELVIWVGEGLTPWLADPVRTLAADASELELLGTDGWTLRPIADEHDEDQHDEHEHEAHDHGEYDPHAWLDPEIAAIWVDHIAQALSDLDPENAAAYMQNAQAVSVSLADLDVSISAQMAQVAGRPVIWPHAAYGYFQDAYGLTAVGAISETDAAPAGPQHIAELRALVTQGAAVCVLSDPEVNTRWSDVLVEGMDVKVGFIDPIGGDIPIGLGQYQAMMAALSQSLAECLAP